MDFRQYLHRVQQAVQRLQLGAGAIATERSMINYPGSSLVEVIRASGHPLNLEPLLLALTDPSNREMRTRFGAAGGELVLIEKALSPDPGVEDLQIMAGGRVANGMPHPSEDVLVPYEVWLRLEMLRVLTMMLEEGRVKSLVAHMQVNRRGGCCWDHVPWEGHAACAVIISVHTWAAGVHEQCRRAASAF